MVILLDFCEEVAALGEEGFELVDCGVGLRSLRLPVGRQEVSVYALSG